MALLTTNLCHPNLIIAFRINKETVKAPEGLIFVRMLGLQLCHSTWHGHLARVDSSA